MESRPEGHVKRLYEIVELKPVVLCENDASPNALLVDQNNPENKKFTPQDSLQFMMLTKYAEWY